LSDQRGRRANARPEFVVRALFDEDELVGTRWWNESFAAFSPGLNRRNILGALWAMPAVKVAAGIGAVTAGVLICSDDDDGPDVSMDALELQRREGWDAGNTDRALDFSFASAVDVRGGTTWRERLAGLATALAPPNIGHRPFAVPTLFQSLEHGPNRRLREVIRPIASPDMATAYDRGRALQGLAEMQEAPEGLAVIVDLPGPQAVAFAAGLSPHFSPVFTFDNWPHPRGVVPSHLTLGAVLYHLPTFEAAARTRPLSAPPAFVLDSARLSPYTDSAWQFDNRYIARIPNAQWFKAEGITRLLYVRPDARQLQELDDLNEDFVALDRAGVEVKTVALTDFERPSPATLAAAPGGAGAGGPAPTTTYYYGGYPHSHVFFWSSYGWGPRPRYDSGAGGRVARAAPLPAPRVSGGAYYRAVERPTIFATRAVGGAAGVGKQKPSGFGRVSVRSGGTWSGGSGRSGSFGRSRSSYWG
jgi:hypothetical protein